MEAFWSLRRESRGKIAGVCGALATRWQVDPLVVRLAAVLLGLSAGVGVVLYLLAWVLLPADDAVESPVQRHAPWLASQSREFWLVTAVIATVVTVVSLGQLAPLGITPALVVLAVWYFGFRRPQQQARRTQQAAPQPHTIPTDPFGGQQTPFTEAAREWQQTVLAHRARTAGTAAAVTPSTRTQVSGLGQPAVSRATPGQPVDRFDADPVRPEPAGAPWGDPIPAATSAPHPASRPLPGRTEVESDARGPWPTTGLSYPAEAPDPPRPEALSDHTAAVRSYLNVPDPAGLYTGSSSRPAGRRRGGNRGTAVLLLVATLVVLAGVATLDVVSPLPIGLSTYLGAALLVSAAVLVVAAFRGRFRGQLLVAGVLLAATVVTAAPQPVLRSTGWEEPAVRYTTLAELPASDAIEAGMLRVDLSDLAVTESERYRISADVGQIELLLPPDTRVDLQAEVDLGSITVDGQQAGGVDLVQQHELGPASDVVLTIDAQVDAGTLVVSTP